MCTVCAKRTIGSDIDLDAPDELLGDVGHVESRSVRLEMVLVLMEDRCTVCAKLTIGSDIVLDAPDGTPRDEAQLGARFSPFGDSVNLDARSVHGLRRRYHRLRNHFGRTRWNS